MKHLIYIILFCFFLSCKDECFITKDDVKTQTTHLVLNCYLQDYENELTRSNSELTWKDKDILIFLFYENGQYINGKAQYDSETEIWSFTYDGKLTPTDNGTLTVYYFPGVNITTSDIVSLSNLNGIYKDEDAKYVYTDEGELRVSAYLVPDIGRIRFDGNFSKLEIEGLSSPVAFDMINRTIIFNDDNILLSNSMKGESYLYVTFRDNTHKLIVNIDNYKYQKNCSDNVLEKGKSGWINLPTIDNQYEWEIIPILPTVRTNKISNVTRKATLSGTLVADGGSEISEYGFYYGLSSSCENKIILGSNLLSQESFSYVLNIIPGMSYYYKAYASNSEGTNYGDIESFIREISLAQTSTPTFSSSIINVNTPGRKFTANSTILDDGYGEIYDYGFVVGIPNGTGYGYIYDFYHVPSGRIGGSNVLDSDYIIIPSLNTPLDIPTPYNYTYSFEMRPPHIPLESAIWEIYSFVVNQKGLYLSSPYYFYFSY